LRVFFRWPPLVVVLSLIGPSFFPCTLQTGRIDWGHPNSFCSPFCPSFTPSWLSESLPFSFASSCKFVPLPSRRMSCPLEWYPLFYSLHSLFFQTIFAIQESSLAPEYRGGGGLGPVPATPSPPFSSHSSRLRALDGGKLSPCCGIS